MIESYRIFFSHGGEDTYIVTNFLQPRIEATGAFVFVDDGQIEYGDDFQGRILEELRGCKELLVLLTMSSLNRPWVFAEIGAALIQNKRIVAIRYGPTESQLQELGILSLLGTTRLLRMEDFDVYLGQLGSRI
ncbi:MAG: hypothetical protein ETSY2_17400 [Candidatus Entotheonella gemina]|uniref:TIR domain-containing protein n=1 Tax=Candidatus Entotheonella gemina TaxID=1429439 RepID=W4M8Z4_9BACT|nr:MAG: hypothetical protein ETSY2_17400 [Candidatus Entotheonella gemina]